MIYTTNILPPIKPKDTLQSTTGFGLVLTKTFFIHTKADPYSTVNMQH